MPCLVLLQKLKTALLWLRKTIAPRSCRETTHPKGDGFSQLITGTIRAHMAFQRSPITRFVLVSKLLWLVLVSKP